VTDRSTGRIAERQVRPLLHATSYLGEDLEHIAVRVAKENRAMAEGVISQRRNKLNAFGFQRRRALGHSLRWDPERQLQGQRTLFGWRVVEASAVDCQRQGRRADTILDPAIIQSTQERELHDGFVEVPHRIHVASKDDGVVDLANLAEWLHGGPL